MLRQRLCFTPKWEGPIQTFAVSYCIKNVWRTQPEFDLDDLIQEARIICWKCIVKYPDVTQPQHFMSLFRVSLVNMISRLANKRTRHSNIKSLTVLGIDQDLSAIAGYCSGDIDDAEIKMMLADAPPEIAKVIRNMSSSLKPRRIRRNDGTRETTNEMLCRVNGQDPSKINLVETITNWLLNGELAT